jgi:hypothetical protein
MLGDTSIFDSRVHEFRETREGVDNIASYTFLTTLGYSYYEGESSNIDLDIIASVLVARISKVLKTTRFDCYEGLS